MKIKNPDQCLAFASQVEWRAWLEAHHATQAEAWLLIRRNKRSGQFISLGEAVEEALCFGWIHGALQPVDNKTYALRFSPRTPHSIWSVNNQRRVGKLIQQGRMAPPGLQKILEAKASGEWDAAVLREDVSSIPDDLVQALEENDAWLAFDLWPDSLKKQYLYWLETAKRIETRENRIKAIVEKALRRR